MTTPPAIAAGSLAAQPQPVLPAAGGLVLRPWADADAGDFLRAYEDPVIRRWHTRQPGSAEQVREWFAQYREAWAAETGASWAVTHDGGAVLGRMALGGFDLSDGVAGCAYWVLPAARGAGVATRALTALSDWALGDGRFHRLHLDHSTRNDASCRVAVKAGFVLEGTKRSDAVHADGRHDMHLHARIRGDAPVTTGLAALSWPLRTERLTIRPATAADADATWAFRRREDVSRWLTRAPATLDEHRASFRAPDALARTLVIEHQGVVIGDLMVRIEDAWAQTEIVPRARGVEAELGWVLHPEHAGHGFATEAVRALLRLCFADLGLRRVTAVCFAANEGSWRLMERVGMRRESATVRDSLHRSGAWLDCFGYALLAEEWRGP